MDFLNLRNCLFDSTLNLEFPGLFPTFRSEFSQEREDLQAATELKYTLLSLRAFWMELDIEKRYKRKKKISKTYKIDSASCGLTLAWLSPVADGTWKHAFTWALNVSILELGWTFYTTRTMLWSKLSKWSLVSRDQTCSKSQNAYVSRHGWTPFSAIFTGEIVLRIDIYGRLDQEQNWIELVLYVFSNI